MSMPHTNFAWTRSARLEPAGPIDDETWTRHSAVGSDDYSVRVTKGKRTDLLALKKNVVSSLKTQVERCRASRTDLYGRTGLEPVSTCPVCQSSSVGAPERAKIYGASYIQCERCTHIFVSHRPSAASITEFYLSDVNYASTYTDRSAAESRLQAIAIPWVRWMCDAYERSWGRPPRRILDVGSGAGHFVEACRRQGLVADGIELSESSRDFARQVWGFELDGRDFTQVAEAYHGVDVVTFWGLLEHTPNPSRIVECARHILSPDGGMVIAKLPRWRSLSSAAQAHFSDTVIRHLDPMGHIMCFTDASAAELFYRCALRPAHVWYYGMDVYETLMQVALSVDEFAGFLGSGIAQTALQQAVDEVGFSDGLTIAVTPRGPNV
jgi:2-polyprenyl-3-methyl-5-hydroxy-6-metoxy-1,4-benzoquinol methylase